MNTLTKRKILRNEQGQAMVEFALIAGLFFMCCFAALQFLFGYYQKHALYLAAKQGIAVIVTTTETDRSQIESEVMTAITQVLEKHGFATMANNMAKKAEGYGAEIIFNVEDPNNSIATVKLVAKPFISLTNDEKSPFHLKGVSAQASTYQNYFG